TPLVVGGPENLLELLDTGQIGDAPTVLAVDAPQDSDEVDSSDVVLTDGLRRRERNFGLLRDATSATLELDDPGRRGAPSRDYTIASRRWETYAELIGARSLTASSSQAYADRTEPVIPEYQPFSAF